MHFQFNFSNLLGTVYHKGDLVFSKDGNSIYVPVGNKITCYDLRNSHSYTLPLEVKGNFTSLTLSPNGLILIGSTDVGGLHMISVMRRRLLYSKPTKLPSKAIAFSPDGKYFAAARGSAVYVYRCSGMEKRVFNPFKAERVWNAATSDITCISWSFDSRLVAFGSADMLTRVFPVKIMQLGKQLYVLGGNDNSITGVHFERDSYDLYTVCKSGKIRFYECLLNPEDLIEKTNKMTEYKKTLERLFNPEDENGQIPTHAIKDQQNEKTWLDYRCRMHYSIHTLLRMCSEDKTSKPELTAISTFLEGPVKSKRVHVYVSASCFHANSSILVVACSTGDFALLDMKDSCAVLHSLNVSGQVISSVAMNLTGDWVAVGVPSVGQLVVWEPRSETYVLKQQGHRSSMSVVAYSPDGSCLASGGEEGKVKLWSSVSSFCFVTFTEHTAAVTGVAFTQSGRAVLSSSLDGTVRAFDLVRYRNFKTLTSPRATQFTCLAVDSSGELVAAGGQDSHQIYLWSLKLGSLLEVLSGHTGPVSSVCFSPMAGSSMMASTAWDGSLKLWDSIATTQARESVTLSADGVCVCIRPDGEQVAVSTLDGHINLFCVNTGAEQGSIQGRRDMGMARPKGDGNTAQKINQRKFYSSLCYSSDGLRLVAGGQTKYVCVYSAAEQLLLKKYTITQNRTLDGVLDVYNYRDMARNGINKTLVELREERDETEEVSSTRGIRLPGVRRGDKALRTVQPEIRVTGIAFAPTGRSFVVCCTEGLLVYSNDTDWLFDPLAVNVDNTPSAVRRKLKQHEWGLALMMAVRLNIDRVKQEVLETIPVDAISVVISNLPPRYIAPLLHSLSLGLHGSRHVGLYARWSRLALAVHGAAIKPHAPRLVTELSALQRALGVHHTTLSKLCASNEYTLNYLRRQSALRKHKSQQQPTEENTEDGDAEEEEDSAWQGSADEEEDVDMCSVVSNFGDSDEQDSVSDDGAH